MKPFRSVVSIVFLLFMASCGEETEPAEETLQGRTVAAAIATTQNVDVYGIDKLNYAVAEKSEALQTSDSVIIKGKTYYILEGINTKAGEELTLTLTTISDIEAAAAMSHNWLLLKQKADPSAFAMASLQARENDYVAPEKMNLVITETGLVAPGETVTITFTTPQQTGEYEYICTFPGHFAAGMRGTLRVK